MLFFITYLLTSLDLYGENSLSETLEILTNIWEPKFEKMIAYNAEVFTVNLYQTTNILLNSELKNVLIYSRSILIQE